jgi:mono/diheme cytochrome c family protein
MYSFELTAHSRRFTINAFPSCAARPHFPSFDVRSLMPFTSRVGFAVAALMAAFLGVASAEEAPAPTAEQAKFFETHVRPLLANNCFKCHGDEKQNGSLRLDSRGAMLAGGDSGAAIEPGAPDASLLLEAVRYESYEMPPSGKLPDEAIDVLARWVEMGAPWPGDQGEFVRAEVEKITEEDRAWWAFQPVRDPQVPQIDDGGWAKNPIDNFIYRELAKHELTPAEEADRIALIRRATYDLTGLPPTPEEIETFLADKSPYAYEALVDRLLESPQYGEHWGRFWLDVVRYAESDGYRQDAYRPDVWRYRDYVVRSFNEDKPYDQFVREQLAGDEIAPDDPQAVTATGFLRLWVYEYNQRDARTQWEEILNDVTDVTGDVFLGMGMGCARCHDHKFDPILQEDYFRLQAFFTPILPIQDRPLFTAEQRREYEEKMAKWEAATAEIRKEIDAIEFPYRRNAIHRAISIFPEDVFEMARKPAEERTPKEHQLAELAHRQAQIEVEKIGDKIKGEERERYDALKKKLAEFDHLKPSAPATTLTVADVGPVAPPTVIPGDRQERDIPPGFLTILDSEPAKIAPPEGLPSTGRRTALAEWINREDNPLTHRVIVNRVWQHHFGEGLVATASDFGRLGEPPSHPELLDWLVQQFLENGRRFKPLHRLIMTSAAYRQLALRPAPEIARMVDPGNRLLWRMNIRRLQAEQVRDTMLMASGELDLTPGGPGVDFSRPRRSIYLKAMRNSPDPLLEAFDAPNGLNSIAKRLTTTTANQALLLFNGPWLLARAKAMKSRLEKDGAADDREFVAAAWRRIYNRPPTTSEMEASLQFLEDQARRMQAPPVSLAEDEPPAAAMPLREGQAADVSDKQDRPRLAVAENPTLPSGDFTIEAFVLLRSLYEDASVRVIASQWNGNNSRPGWSLGVTSTKSNYTPRNLILQLVTTAVEAGPTYEVIPSDLLLDLNKPYYVAASVRVDGTEQPEATFYVKDLAATDKPLHTAKTAFQGRGAYRSDSALVLGGRDGHPKSNWDGLIDDVRLSAAVLPPEQLLVNNIAALDTTIGLWRFENQPGFFADESNHDNRLQPAVSASRSGDPHAAARVDFCHVLLNSNGFLYLD